MNLTQVTGDLGIVKTSTEVLIPAKVAAEQNGTAGFGKKIWRGIESEQAKAGATYKPIFAEISADPMRELTAKRAERELREQLAQYKVDVFASHGLVDSDGVISADKKSPATTQANAEYVARSNRVSRLCLGIRVAGLGRFDEVESLGFDAMLNACRAILAEVDGRLNKDGTIRPKKAKAKAEAETATESVDVNKASEWMAALETLVKAGLTSEDALVKDLSASIEKMVQNALAAEVAAQLKAA